jgi:hypothetical protein
MIATTQRPETRMMKQVNWPLLLMSSLGEPLPYLPCATNVPRGSRLRQRHVREWHEMSPAAALYFH